MILRRHQSLGMLPELITFVFLAAAVTTLGLVAVRVAFSTPLVLVPNAIGAGALAPARADDEYCRAFAANALAHWATWNEYTYRYRTGRAIALMTPSARPPFTAHVERVAALVTSLSQSQVLALDELRIADLGPGLHAARFAGTLTAFYGGVGGAPEAYRGELLLREIAPTPDRPLCLEIAGFVVDRPHAPDTP